MSATTQATEITGTRLGKDAYVPRFIPHANKSTSWDMLRSGDSYYIIRNDLGSSRALGFKFDNDVPGLKSVKVFDVCEAMSAGTSYFGRASDDGKKHYKYCLKGSSVIRVDNIETGEGLEAPKELNAANTGGLHYFQRSGKFYVLDASGKFGCGDSLQQPIARTKSLRMPVENILAICGSGDYFYVLADNPTTGLVIDRYKNLEKADKNDHDQYQVPDVVKRALPGGIGVTMGPTVAQWIPIFKSKNDSTKEVKVTWALEVKVGFSKSKMESITKSWEISTSRTAKVGTEVASAEVNLSAKYGEASTSSTTQTWDEEVTKNITQEVTILGGETATCYQLTSVFKGENDPLLGTLVLNVCDDPDGPKDSAQDVFNKLYGINP